VRLGRSRTAADAVRVQGVQHLTSWTLTRSDASWPVIVTSSAPISHALSTALSLLMDVGDRLTKNARQRPLTPASNLRCLMAWSPIPRLIRQRPVMPQMLHTVEASTRFPPPPVRGTVLALPRRGASRAIPGHDTPRVWGR
jgi:hypothetical protein